MSPKESQVNIESPVVEENDGKIINLVYDQSDHQGVQHWMTDNENPNLQPEILKLEQMRQSANMINHEMIKKQVLQEPDSEFSQKGVDLSA